MTGSPSPYAGNAAAADASPYSRPSTKSVWIDDPPDQQVTMASMRPVSTSPARRHDGAGNSNRSAFSRYGDRASAVGSSYGGGDAMFQKNGPGSPEKTGSPENRSVSPPPTRLGRPSSIVWRISDKGGGSLPGSPTPGGNRYGRTDQLVGGLKKGR